MQLDTKCYAEVKSSFQSTHLKALLRATHLLENNKSMVESLSANLAVKNQKALLGAYIFKSSFQSYRFTK